MPDCWAEASRSGASVARPTGRNLGCRLLWVGLWLGLLAGAGCGFSGGPSVLDLDREQDFQQELEVGEELVLDVRDPVPGGYELAGTAFDPVVVRFTSYGTGPATGARAGRVRFGFTALTPGETLVEIRVRPTGAPEAMLEVYKRVLVIVTAD